MGSSGAALAAGLAGSSGLGGGGSGMAASSSRAVMRWAGQGRVRGCAWLVTGQAAAQHVGTGTKSAGGGGSGAAQVRGGQGREHSLHASIQHVGYR